MLRAMLSQAFGMRSYSMYDDPSDIGMIPEVGEHVGHAPLGTSFKEFYYRELYSKGLTLVKTHGKPADNNLAIYIVRDGRSSIVSWYNMLRQAKKQVDVSISDIIFGHKVAFGDWSSHVRSWNPKYNPNRLLLYYQDLVSRPAAALQLMSDFTGQRQTGQWHDNFRELHRLYPEFFAGGSDEKNIAQMTKEESELFWSRHAETMLEFGFAA